MRQWRFNGKLLAWLVGTAAASAAAVHFVHSSQMKRHGRTFLAEADRDERDGKLDRAAEDLKRYLSFNPGDVDALAHYGAVLDKTAATVSDRLRAAEVYEKVLVADRTRQNVRRRVLDLYLQLGWFIAARRHAEALAEAQPDDPAVLVMLGRCFEAEGDTSAARKSYEDAVARDSHSIEAWARLARLFRRTQLSGRAAEALDEMVRANDADAAAYLERAFFRLDDGDLKGAADDLAEARKRDPKDARILLASADVAQRRGDAPEARKWWAKGVAAHDNDPALSAGLVALDLQQGRPEAALAVVEKVRERHPLDSELNYLYTEALLQLNRFDKVRAVIVDLREQGEQPGLANYFEARLALHQGRPLDAVRVLTETQSQRFLPPGLAAHVQLCLGQAFEQVGDSGRALAAYRRAVELNGALVLARVRLGTALLTAGVTDAAAEQFEAATRLPLPPPETWTLLARARLRQTLTLPAPRRDWDRVEALLDRAGANAGQAVPVALLRADVRVARDRPADAEAVLAKACAKLRGTPDVDRLWAARARLAARLGQSRRAAEVLDEARAALGDSAELRLAELECRPEAAPLKTVAFLRSQETGLDRFKPADRARVVAALAAAHYRVGNRADGDRLTRGLVVGLKNPSVDDWVRLLDLALQGNDDGLVTEVAAGLKKLEGEKSGSWWRYAEAARLVVKAMRGDRAGMAEARAALGRVTKLRPNWGRALLLQAWLDDATGEGARAVDGYLCAFDLGERPLPTVQRLVQLLVERGRYGDADDVLRRCQEQVVPRGDFARTAAEVALRAGSSGRAVVLARLAVPEDTTDPARRLWLGRMYAAAGQSARAEAEFRTVIDGAFDTEKKVWRYDPLDAWLLLVTQLAHDHRRTDAEAAVEDLRRRLPADQQPFALGVCYEALGRVALAEENYRAALDRNRNEAALIQRLAALYLRTGRAKLAEPLLLRLLGPSVVASEEHLAWARRQLALLLADGGGDANYRGAVALLEENRKGGRASAVDARALSLVEATRPERRAAALKALEDARALQSLPPDELYRMARLYADLADGWPRARELMDEALKADPSNPEYVARHIADLLRHNAPAEARRLVESLAGLEGESPRVRDFRAELTAVP